MPKGNNEAILSYHEGFQESGHGILHHIQCQGYQGHKNSKRVWDTEGGTRTATSGFEGCQEVKSKLRSSESTICIQISGATISSVWPVSHLWCVAVWNPGCRAWSQHSPCITQLKWRGKQHSPGSKLICSALGKHRYIARTTARGTLHCLSAMHNSRASSGYIYAETYTCVRMCVSVCIKYSSDF